MFVLAVFEIVDEYALAGQLGRWVAHVHFRTLAPRYPPDASIVECAMGWVGDPPNQHTITTAHWLVAWGVGVPSASLGEVHDCGVVHDGVVVGAGCVRGYALHIGDRNRAGGLSRWEGRTGSLAGRIVAPCGRQIGSGKSEAGRLPWWVVRPSRGRGRSGRNGRGC
jgi:hypothetical protein